MGGICESCKMWKIQEQIKYQSVPLINSEHFNVSEKIYCDRVIHHNTVVLHHMAQPVGSSIRREILPERAKKKLFFFFFFHLVLHLVFIFSFCSSVEISNTPHFRSDTTDLSFGWVYVSRLKNRNTHAVFDVKMIWLWIREFKCPPKTFWNAQSVHTKKVK